MRKTFSTLKGAGLALLLACLGTVLVSASSSSSDKDTSKSSSATKTQTVWNTASAKTPLKRETLPIPSAKLGSGGKSSESLRTASQTLFGYNGMQGGNVGGFNNGYNGFGGQFGFSPSYVGGGGGGGRFGVNGYNQYSQLGGNAYNVLEQTQGNLFGGQGQNPYYTNNYFGAAQGFNPYASTGGIGGGSYQFGNPQGSFGFGGFGNQGFYPGAQFQGQVGQRNFGFVNQGFGNPAYRNPQGAAVSGTTGGFNSIPSSVQVGTGLEVGSRGFSSGGAGNAGGFPSASGQQYIVGNGIGQPAFIGAHSPTANGFGGIGGPYGMYSPGIPGGVYRQPNSIFGPYDYPRALSSGTPSPSSITSRPSSPATRLQTSGPNRFYQGVSPSGTYAPGSRERLYRFTASNER